MSVEKFQAQDWIEYRSKSGEVLFHYNQITSEHRYSDWNPVSKKWELGQTIDCNIVNKTNNIMSQTEDCGCINGCTSIYACIDRANQQQWQTSTIDQSNCSTQDAVTVEKALHVQDWIEYRCKAGEVLFYYNKITTEHRYPEWNPVSQKWDLSIDPNIVQKKNSIMTQTNDTGCGNGCTSMYADIHSTNLHQYTTTEQLHNLGAQHKAGIDERNEESNSDENSEVMIENMEEEIQPSTLCHQSSGDIGTDNTSSKEMCTEQSNQAPNKVGSCTLVNISAKTKSYKCKHCSKIFKTRGNCQIHERIHSGEKPYKCKHCSKTFSQSGSCKIHERIHSGEKPYKCKHCSKTFTQIGICRNHERIHSGEKPYKCKYCSKAFSDVSACGRHERIHSGEKPYKCKYCSKTFRFSGGWRGHERIHSGEKPYKCKHCSKAFSDVSAYKRHTYVHSGERPYKCKHGSKTFTQSGHCSSHEESHTGEKPYQCKYCSKTFSRSDSCKIHERIHTGEKPYKCKYCSKAFTQSYVCRVHEHTHSDKKP